MSSINLNNTSFTDSGTLRFSGLSSGIDFQATIEAIMLARRQPVANIEEKITLNATRKTTIEELQGLSSTFTSVLDELRGSNSFFTTDVFKTKQAFATSAAADGAPADHTPSAAGSLVGITATTDAAVGTHRMTVQQLARAHQIRSDSFSSLTDSMATLGVTAGTMTINGVGVNVTSTDNLADVRDKINASGAGVTATIVSASDTSHYLVFNANDSGADNAMTFSTDYTTSDSLGFTVGADGTIKNELRAGVNAIIDVNGITGIERSSNTIDDVIEGVTLSLFAAETDTEVTIDIENNLNDVKTKITEFVDAYNAIREFVSDQRVERDRDEDGDVEYGALAFDSTLTQVAQRMGDLVSREIAGLADGYQSLSQIGITVAEDFTLEINEDTLDTKLLNGVADIRKLFTFDFSSSDSRVTFVSHDGNPTYTTDGSNNVNPYYLNIGGIDGTGVITSANISDSSGNGTASDGSISNISTKTLTVGSASDAQGLKVLYSDENGSGPASDIEIRFTRGVADQLYFFFQDLTKTDGTFDGLVDQVEQQTEDYESEIVTLETRLDNYRSNLEARFIAMEAVLAQLNSVRDTIEQYNEALNGSN